MNLEYEISAQDFLNAQTLAIKKSPIRFIRWTRLVLPLFGLGGLVFLTYVVMQQGFSWRLIPASIFPVGFLSMPLLNKWGQKRAYAKTTNMHGKLSIVLDEAGLKFEGPTFSSQVRWAHFVKFLEDEHSFLLYQNPQVFNIIPKRALALDQIDGLRALLKTNIPAR